MDKLNFNTKRSKGQHLTYEERVEIEIRLKDGWSLGNRQCNRQKEGYIAGSNDAC